MKARKAHESSSISRSKILQSESNKSRIERKRESVKRRTEKINDPLNKTLYGAVKPEPGEKRYWWDGCLYKCNLCALEFPDTNDITNHIDKLHRREARETMMKFIYSAVKVTYFNCKICVQGLRRHKLKFRSYPGMRLKCQKSSVMSHLKLQHSLESISEYEKICKGKLKQRGVRKAK